MGFRLSGREKNDKPMKNVILFTIIISASFAFSACNSKGEPVDHSSACSDTNNKKYIEVSGLLKNKGGIFCSNTSGRMECGFRLMRDEGDTEGFTADLEVGSSSNTVEKIERNFKPEDIKIRDDKGEFVKLGEKVKLTGMITAVKDATSPTGGVCYLKVDKIER